MMDASDPLRACLNGPAPRATRFIVTLYGDVVAPRGGVLWMGTLIECCAVHGISESLVRTAVSRLVSAGRLEGERIGRRSYYRLTAGAQAEFSRAAQLFYAPPPAPVGWLVALVAPEVPDPDWARLGAAAIAPARSDIAVPPGPVLSAEVISGAPDLPAFAAAHWPLAEAAQAYHAVLNGFSDVEQALDGAMPDGALALALRLRLIHRYRQAALIDPRLPTTALPPAWPGTAARALFVRLYLALTEAADAHVGQVFCDADGLLPAETEGTRLRLDRLRREAAR